VAVANAAELAAAVGRLIDDPSALATLRDRARAVHDGLKPDLGAIAGELARLADASP
jgi:hypothetical protein